MMRYLVPKRPVAEDKTDNVDAGGDDAGGDDAGGDDAGGDDTGGDVVDGLRRPKKRAKHLSSSILTYHHQRTAIIYAYLYKKGEGTQHAYVGQTPRALSVRDSQHIGDSRTKFDKLHTSKITSPFLPPIVLETKMFEATGTDSIDVEAQVLAECCAWMDMKENYFISKFKTDSSASGLNQTKRGSNFPRNKAYFQAQTKKSLLK
jgi:hypothetical protein